MGESACVVEGSGFSKIDIAAVLRESVSFGRFMTEPLDWGKWSSFSQNRYIEEAEKYSARGSVAQKKAYFEEHYKRIAAKKAAELLEQDNNATLCTSSGEGSQNEYEDSCLDSTDAKPEMLWPTAKVEEFDDPNSGRVHAEIAVEQYLISDSYANILNRVEAVESADTTSSLVRDGDNSRELEIENSKEETGLESKDQQEPVETYGKLILEDKCKKSKDQQEPVETYGKLILEDKCKKIEVEPCKDNQLQKSPLKENNTSSNQVPSVADAEIKTFANKSSPVRRMPKLPLPSLKPRSPTLSKKEINLNSGFLGRKASKIKASTQTSSHVSVLASPNQQKGGTTLEGGVPKACKASESKVNFGCFKAFQDFSMSYCRTPTKDSAKDEPTIVPVAPHLENRSRTPSENIEPRTKKSNAKWNSILNCGKSCISSNKSCSQQSVSSFSFRSEERAEKRKEYFMKLEEKLNMEKLEREAKAKEKAENELKLLRQSLGFKARPLPKFYRKSETSKQDVKKSNPETKPQSPKPGRTRRGAVCSNQ